MQCNTNKLEFYEAILFDAVICIRKIWLYLAAVKIFQVWLNLEFRDATLKLLPKDHKEKTKKHTKTITSFHKSQQNTYMFISGVCQTVNNWIQLCCMTTAQLYSIIAHFIMNKCITWPPISLFLHFAASPFKIRPCSFSRLSGTM